MTAESSKLLAEGKWAQNVAIINGDQYDEGEQFSAPVNDIELSSPRFAGTILSVGASATERIL